MPKTKGQAATTKAWMDSHGRVQGAYADGVKRTTDWNAKSIAGEANYAAGVQRAASEGTRAKALAKVSDADWQNAAINKGAGRIVQGMKAGESKYNGKIGAVLGVIESVSIPARTQDSDANIDNRLKPIARALQDAKRAGNF